MRTLVLASVILKFPFSFSAPGPGATHQPTGPSPGCLRPGSQQGRDIAPYQQAHCLKTPRAQSRRCPRGCLHLTLHDAALTQPQDTQSSADRDPETQLCPPADRQKPLGSLGRGSIYQQAYASYKTPCTPRPAALGSSPTHQKGNTRFEGINSRIDDIEE